MKAGLRIIIFGLIAVLFMSTTGVAVYKHYCNQSKMAQSVFVMLDNNCDMLQLAEEDCQLDYCHKDNTDQIHDDCCSHNLEYYHINTDLFNHNFKVEIAKILPSTPINGLSITESVVQQEEPVVPNPPPSLTTPQRLSLYQIYLI